MQNQQKSLPYFKSIESKPMVFLNCIFGLFWIFFVLVFIGGIVFILTSSSEETGFDEIAAVAFFLIMLAGISAIVAFVMYSRKKMFTTTIIDEKGIRYVNKFNNKVVKDLPWSSFAKREKLAHVFQSPKFDIVASTPMKSFFDQFYWPVLVNKKAAIHSDAFTGKHFFMMFYANRLELIRAFLLGVAHYRPDITVDPIIFSNHYIDPENYNIDYRQQQRIRILSAVFCILILGLIYYFVD
ncbi:hypothetical protein [Flavobacterium sp. FlaQc-47]|uniref:hypothetical protein n=1 Tax=Flavobacterium sp. FlaQc-47 TaxID=3374180 RepID=UPI003757C08C